MSVDVSTTGMWRRLLAPVALPGPVLHRRMPEAWFLGAVWLFLSIPPLALSLAEPKRYMPLTEGGQNIPAGVAHVTTACNALVLVACAVALVVGWRTVPWRDWWRLALVLLPWAVVVLRLVGLDRSPGGLALVYPAIAVGLWALRPRFAVVELAGYLTAVLAAVSVLLGAFVPSAGIVERAEGAELEKPVGPFGVLAGTMLSGNHLAILLTLGLGAVLTIRRLWARIAALAVTLVAVLWTASRTAGAAVALLVVALVVVRLLRSRGDRARLAGTVAAAGIGVLALVGVVLPFVTTSGDAFNHRGRIWTFALGALGDGSPALGLGADYFKVLATQDVNLGGFASHGHNLTVQMLVTGGVALAAVVAGLLVWAAVRAVRSVRSGFDWPLLYLVVFFVQAVLEVPLDFDDRVREFPYTVALFLVLLLARPVPGAAEVGGLPAGDGPHGRDE